MGTIELMPCVQSCGHRDTAISRIISGTERFAHTAHAADPAAHAAKAGRARRMKRSREARERHLRLMLIRFMLVCVLAALGAGAAGMATQARSRNIPVSYKYYDTITVAYQENLLDIVERYDDRDHYATQDDYVRDLCRINNIAYDGTSYPQVSPGTQLVVPYYSQELK